MSENLPPNGNAVGREGATSEHQVPPVLGRRTRGSDDRILELGPRKRASRTDPLVHHGRHFGRAIQAFCKVQTLIKHGLNLKIQLHSGDVTEETLCAQERREYRIFQELLRLSPGIEERLCVGSDQEIFYVAEMIMKGSSGARSDDTKSLKGVILEWITPRDGFLRPPLSRNIKTDRGFHHETTGKLLCPVDLDWSDPRTREQLRSGEIIVSGEQWPLFLFRDFKYNDENPWDGLFRSDLLVSAYKHIFTSPSSVEKEPRATRSGNARIHGMVLTTIPSLAYVATQVRFALSSSPIFSRTDLVTDSERFYNSVIEMLEDPDEHDEVNELLTWWNRRVFPVYTTSERLAHKDCVIAKIKARRNVLKNFNSTNLPTSST